MTDGMVALTCSALLAILEMGVVLIGLEITLAFLAVYAGLHFLIRPATTTHVVHVLVLRTLQMTQKGVFPLATNSHYLSGPPCLLAEVPVFGNESFEFLNLLVPDSLFLSMSATAIFFGHVGAIGLCLECFRSLSEGGIISLQFLHSGLCFREVVGHVLVLLPQDMKLGRLEGVI